VPNRSTPARGDQAGAQLTYSWHPRGRLASVGPLVLFVGVVAACASLEIVDLARPATSRTMGPRGRWGRRSGRASTMRGPVRVAGARMRMTPSTSVLPLSLVDEDDLAVGGPAIKTTDRRRQPAPG
jgi:hypothetical protein